jgi:hypothetical protein
MLSPYATLPKPLRRHALIALEAHNVNRSLIPGDRTAKPVRYAPKRTPFTRENYRTALGSYFLSVPKPKRSPEWLLAQPKDFQDVFWNIAFNKGDRAAAVFLGASLYDTELHPEGTIEAKAKNQHSPIYLPNAIVSAEIVALNIYTGMVYISGHPYKLRMTDKSKDWKFIGILKDEDDRILTFSASSSQESMRRTLRMWIKKHKVKTQHSLEVYPLEVKY